MHLHLWVLQHMWVSHVQLFSHSPAPPCLCAPNRPMSTRLTMEHAYMCTQPCNARARAELQRLVRAEHTAAEDSPQIAWGAAAH